jgi:hypothetical protein
VLGFRDPEAAKQIFREWRGKLGEIDEEEQLRVTVVTGIDRRNPSSYKLLISANPKLRRNSRDQFVLVYRINRLDPPDSRNLNAFLERYKSAGQYVVIPAHFAETSLPEPFWELGIGKRQLRIIPAWRIDENDPDVCAIQESDDPIIPDDIKNAPVVRALHRFAERKKRRRR